MSESKEYVSQALDNGAIHISEEVIVSIAAMAAMDVEGVYGLASSADLGKLKKKNTAKDVHVEITEDDQISIDCYIVVLYGHSVVDVAKNVQDAVASTVASTTGRIVRSVNVSIGGISLPRTGKK